MGGIVGGIGNAVGGVVGGLTGGLGDVLAGGKTQVTGTPLLNSTNQPTDFGAMISNRMNTPGAQDQFRTGQEGLVQALQAMAAGTGPSLVQNQLQQGTDQNIAQQMALASSQHGINSGMASRLAAQNGGMIQQQAAQQAAGLRNQEQMGAMGGLANVLSQGRGQDIQNQGTQDQFVQGLIGLGNQRDLGQLQANSGQNLKQGELDNAYAARKGGAIGGILSGAGAAFGL